MVYICAKFREIILNGIKVIERTRMINPLTEGRTDGQTETQKFGGYNIIPRHFLWRGIIIGRVVRWCWVNFQCWGVLTIWIIEGQGPTAFAVGADGGCLAIFSLVCHFSTLSPSLWEMARYRLNYCLKGPLSPKQPTNQHVGPKP